MPLEPTKADLESFSDKDLIEELNRRAESRKKGLCDYCNKPLLSQPYCLHRQRHFQIAENYNPIVWTGK